MKIVDVDTREPLKSVGIELSRAEASELIDSLTALLGRPGGTASHEHVSSRPDYQIEISVWLESDGQPP